MLQHFLHLSDLHFRGDWPEESDLVLRRFLDDLAGQAANFPNALLIFSGDLVQAGGESGLYAEFETRISAALTSAGFPADRRICVPGNHDVSRSELKPKVTMQQGSLGAMTDEETFNRNMPLLSQTFFTPTFKEYGTCEKGVAHYTCCSDGPGGHGWELPSGVGVYCLNSALCSFGGLEDAQGKKIDDKGLLMIDTRSLQRWLAENTSTSRVLVMHHPIEWLADWAREELENIIAESFQLVVSGHVHRASAAYSSRGAGGSVHCVSPALFTRKSEALGYSFITLDEAHIDVSYRQWTATHKFVAGSAFSGTDSGVMHFPFGSSGELLLAMVPRIQSLDALGILQEEFDEAVTCYSSKKRIWVERDLANVPEAKNAKKEAKLTSSSSLSEKLTSCVIRAPKQFGLTCLGRFLALQYSKKPEIQGTIAMIDMLGITPNAHAAKRAVKRRCAELQIEQRALKGLILDNWQNDKGSGIILRELRSLLPSIPIVVLHSIDDVANITDRSQVDELADFENLYLWSMNRTRIRELSCAYVKDIPALEEGAVAKKVTEEIDSLNLHRTPLNCLTILKLLEQAFDDSPVNRTEMIGRVLHLLFFEFQGIPRYSERPDLKDCEHALGYLCQWLIESQRTAFTKNEFIEKVTGYCRTQVVNLDSEVLFAFLISENIFIRRGSDFEFRFRYWIYYFAAHRMYHSKEFANFILSAGRYAAFPEIIEFYTGIDRTREDAVRRLTDDLRGMNEEFLKRTNIAEDFEPWENAQWVPSEPVVQNLLKEVMDSAADSELPIVVKEAIADQTYDRSKPYNQELAKFLAESSLRQMISTMKGAARALRNSDYVDPELKMALMEEVVCCWRRICQILALLSPFLAEQGRAYFEGMNFRLDESWDDVEKGQVRFEQVFSAIPYNITLWHQGDIFSRKMGALFSKYIAAHPGSLNEALILLVMVSQRSPGWEKEVDSFIERSNKNSFYLSQVFSGLFGEFKTGITNEKTRQQIRRLAAKAIAKHEGAKHPSPQVIERRAKGLDESLDQ